MENETEKDNEALTAKTVLDNYKQAKEYVSGSYWSTWDKCYKVYNNQRVKRGYNGTADITDPIVYSNIQTILANLVAAKPRFDYIPTRPNQEKDAEVLNKMVDYYWECNNMSFHIIPWIKDVLIYGTGLLFTYWDIDKPKIMHWPLKDAYFDPAAHSIDDAEWVVRRFLTTKDELADFEVVDTKSKKMTPMYKNLDQIREEGKGDDQDTDKQRKDMFNGSTLGEDAQKDQIEVLEMWTEDKIIAIANRETVIREDTNPYGFIPFIVQRNDIDSSLFYGKGSVEPVIDQQEYLNDLINQSLDNVTYVLNNMWTLDPAYADMIEDIESVPGAVYALPEGALRPIEKPIMTNNSLNERQEIKNSIRETNNVDEVIKGVGQDRGNADVTATEINQQVQSASKKIGLQIELLENEGYKRLGVLWFKMMQKFLSNKSAVRVNGKEGIDWQVFSMSDYKGEYEPVVKLDTTLKAMQAEESQRWQGVYTSMMGNPNVNQIELDKMFLEKTFQLQPDEVEKLIQPTPGIDPASAMVGMPQNNQNILGSPTMPSLPGAPGGSTGIESTKEAIVAKIDFKDLPEDSKHALLDEMGIPSQMPSPVQQNMGIQAAKIQTDVHKKQLDHAQQLQQAEMAQEGAMNGQTTTPEPAGIVQ